MDEALEIRTDIQGRPGSRRRVRNGKATNDLVLSASADGNDRMFPHILALYVNEKHVSRSSSGSLQRCREGSLSGFAGLRSTELLSARTKVPGQSLLELPAVYPYRDCTDIYRYELRRGRARRAARTHGRRPVGHIQDYKKLEDMQSIEVLPELLRVTLSTRGGRPRWEPPPVQTWNAPARMVPAHPWSRCHHMPANCQLDQRKIRR